jgi:hypothetical protein
VPDAADLLAVARLLSIPGPEPRSYDAQLRRAVSTAYYALFHSILRAAAQRFMGREQENAAGYAIIYRSFDHGHMKRVCEALRVSTLKDKFRYHLRRTSVSQDMRDFAAIFPILQDARQHADYDPTAEFPTSEVSSLVDAAEVAMAAFERTAADEQADVLALMMVRTRD